MAASLVLPKLIPELCDGCGDCVNICHANALAIRDERVVFLRADDCDYCTDCEAVCPLGAIACPFEIVVGG
jgi:ferredoxin